MNQFKINHRLNSTYQSLKCNVSGPKTKTNMRGKMTWMGFDSPTGSFGDE